jgi:hypothetical protein
LLFINQGGLGFRSFSIIQTIPFAIVDVLFRLLRQRCRGSICSGDKSRALLGFQIREVKLVRDFLQDFLLGHFCGGGV